MNAPKVTYADTAYRGDAISEQPAPKPTNGFVEVVEAGDFLERLSWGNYANLDVNVGSSGSCLLLVGANEAKFQHCLAHIMRNRNRSVSAQDVFVNN